MFIDFKFICLTKSLTNKFILCNSIINNESITIHNVPIIESVVSVCSVALDELSDSGRHLSESAYESSCAWEWLAIAEL